MSFLQCGARVALLISLLLGVACSDSSDSMPASAKEARQSLRDARYCEVTPLYFTPEGITSDTWNTSGLSDCPKEDWEALDFNTIGEELGALVVRANGPRHWVFDVGELKIEGEPEYRFFGNLEFQLMANVQYDFTPPPPGTYFFEARVKRNTEFRFYRDWPVYELLAPMGKRYAMQSYSQIVDPQLGLADLDNIGSRIELPIGWEYRVRQLEEDLLVEDFQGFATAMRDQLENTYQRAETLEYLPEGWVALELVNNDTRQSWSAILDRGTADALVVTVPWEKLRQVSVADKSLFAQSPDEVVDGRFQQMAIAEEIFNHTATTLCEPELHSSGLINTNQSRRFQELTFKAGRTVPYIVNHLDEKFVLTSHISGSEEFQNNLPPDWRHEEVLLTDDWRVVFAGVVDTVEIVDGSQRYQGPVLLPGELAPPTPAQVFTHKMIMPTGGNPFAQKAYECPHCTFEQLESIDPPPGWRKGPTQILFAEGELRRTPCAVPSTVDFLPEVPGNEYEIIARPQSGRLVEFTPQGPIVLTNVERYTELRFPAGRRIHELTSPGGDVYVLFAYDVDSMDVDMSDFQSPDLLDGYPRPTGWSYSTRILERELMLDSTGVVSVLAFQGSIPSSTWEKR